MYTSEFGNRIPGHYTIAKGAENIGIIPGSKLKPVNAIFW